MPEGLDLLPSLITHLRDHGVLDHQVLQVACLVDFTHKLPLGNIFALVYQKGHDGLWDQVGDVLFDNSEVALNEVLNNHSLHNDARVLGSCTHFGLNRWQYNGREVGFIEMSLIELEARHKLEPFISVSRVSALLSCWQFVL